MRLTVRLPSTHAPRAPDSSIRCFNLRPFGVSGHAVGDGNDTLLRTTPPGEVIATPQSNTSAAEEGR